ncbi:hypothetical protein NF865_06030 [Thermococcus aggregans]|uniref:Transglutaminase-like domain-containing protein n=1 Tax=Thermococcus aggregans TaxID=110163 RepID=A0A9E7MW80_THEAG|nr:transglutaminase-like domain-containing protein [Thermococcus aggregans]USS39922.1 hypothetical protein NF865_06030 [Thermococcus aggregans]
MYSRIIAIFLVIISIASGCVSSPKVLPSSSLTPTETCEEIDYYFLDSAIEYAITPEEITALLPIANNLKGESIKEDVWRILEWEDGNIKYDFEKASLPPARITTYPTGKVEINGGSKIQRPSETISTGKGICTDYTVLTLALLFAMNYSEAYALEINFENDKIGHATALVKINGKFFVLDQKPPVMDLGSYYLHWKNVEGKVISNATLYRVLWSNGTNVEKIGILYPSDFLKEDYTFTKFDANRLALGLIKMMESEFPNLKKDENLKNDRLMGYSSGKRWLMTFPNFAMYYNPEFHEQFVSYIYSRLTSTPEVLTDLSEYEYFWVTVEAKEDDLEIELVLARR